MKHLLGRCSRGSCAGNRCHVLQACDLKLARVCYVCSCARVVVFLLGFGVRNLSILVMPNQSYCAVESQDKAQAASLQSSCNIPSTLCSLHSEFKVQCVEGNPLFNSDFIRDNRDYIRALLYSLGGGICQSFMFAGSPAPMRPAQFGAPGAAAGFRSRQMGSGAADGCRNCMDRDYCSYGFPTRTLLATTK